MANQPIFSWQWIAVLIGAAVATAAVHVFFFGSFAFVFLLVVCFPVIIGAIVVFLVISSFFGRKWFVRANSLLAVVGVVTTVFFIDGVAISVPLREKVRWLGASAYYKAQVSAQPEAPDGEFKHIEWDGWGMAGQDTSVFLVFDPGDVLAEAAASGKPGKFVGLPCLVWSVHRLEDHWYSAVFFTNTYWGACGD